MARENKESERKKHTEKQKENSKHAVCRFAYRQSPRQNGIQTDTIRHIHRKEDIRLIQTYESAGQ